MSPPFSQSDHVADEAGGGPHACRYSARSQVRDLRRALAGDEPPQVRSGGRQAHRPRAACEPNEHVAVTVAIRKSQGEGLHGQCRRRCTAVHRDTDAPIVTVFPYLRRDTYAIAVT